MFIVLGYLALTLVQIYRQIQRRRHYAGVMLRAVRSGSVLVQRGKCPQHGSAGALLNSSLLSCSKSYRETQLLSDENLAVSVVCPKQKVDLGEWTSYLDIHPAQESSNSVIALLEAGRPDDLDAFLASAKKVPLAHQIHVLKHGCPIAWKSGSPFGIILHCNYQDFVLLCDAFGQGYLSLNEDLELHRMLTISTIGRPKSLRRPKSEEFPASVPKEDHLKTKRANTDPVHLLASAPQISTSTESESTAIADLVKTRRSHTEPIPGLAAGEPELTVCTDVAYQTTVTVTENSSGTEVTNAEPSLPSPPAETKPVLYISGAEDTTAMGSSTEISQANGDAQEQFVSADFEPISAAANGSPVTLTGAAKLNGSESDVASTNEPTSDAFDAGDAAFTKPADEVKEEISAETGTNLSSDTVDTEVVHDINGQSPPVNGVNNAPFSGAPDHDETSADRLTSESKGVLNGASSVTLDQSTPGQIIGNGSVPPNAFTPEESQTPSENGSLAKDNKSPEKATVAQSEQVVHATNGSQQDLIIVKGSSQNHVENNTSGTARVPESPKVFKTEGIITQKSDTASVESPAKSSNGAANVGNGSASQEMKSGKPPNVVVYCGKKDSSRKFDIIKTGLEQCLNTDAYSIYILPHDDIMTLPWEDNCAALLISHDYLHDNINKKCTDFLQKGGRVISFGSSMEAEFIRRKEVLGRPTVTKFGLLKWRDVSATQGRYCYVRGSLKKNNSSMDALVLDPKSGDPLVVQLMLSAEQGNGKAIFSQLFLESDPSAMALDSKMFSRLKQSNIDRLQVLRYLLSLLDLDTSPSTSHTLTPCYILTKEQTLKKSLMDAIAGRMKQNSIKSRSLNLKFVSVKSGAAALTPTIETLPVVTDLTSDSSSGQVAIHFDPEGYWRHLTSAVLGRLVFYTDIIPTTMTVFEGIQFSIPEEVGVIAVAGRQTSGKGRGGNTWLSPIGCAMFTLPLQLPVDSILGQRVSFLQHIASLAVVHSIRSMPGYEDLDLRLKWPNDIYYGNKMKLGGVLVTSTIMGKAVHASIGCGVNVANSQPTICINDVIQQLNHEKGLNLKPLTTSEVLARTVSEMEVCLKQFQKKGHKDFCQLYYKYWLHSGVEVKVESEGNIPVQIRGLDDFGFLRVVNKQGEQLSVQPDGNSFDMLRNLIAVKRD